MPRQSDAATMQLMHDAQKFVALEEEKVRESTTHVETSNSEGTSPKAWKQAPGGPWVVQKFQPDVAMFEFTTNMLLGTTAGLGYGIFKSHGNLLKQIPLAPTKPFMDPRDRNPSVLSILRQHRWKVLRYSRAQALQFGLFATVFSGVDLCLSHWRDKKDVWNRVAGGAVSGGVFGTLHFGPVGGILLGGFVAMTGAWTHSAASFSREFLRQRKAEAELELKEREEKIEILRNIRTNKTNETRAKTEQS